MVTSGSVPLELLGDALHRMLKGVAVNVGRTVLVGVTVGVNVAVGVGVLEGVVVSVGEGVAVGHGVQVALGDAVGDGDPLMTESVCVFLVVRPRRSTTERA